MKIAIIGGGLAGCAAAYVLKQYGITPVIYETANDIAQAASGNAIGLYNPKLGAFKTPLSLFYASAFALANTTFKNLENIDYTPCGALHLITDEKREKRFTQTIENWGWHQDHMQLVTAEQATKIANTTITHPALYLTQSGFVSPQKLCRTYTKDIEIITNYNAKTLPDADAVILANAIHAKTFAPDLPLKSVRGQVTYAKTTPASKSLKTCINYGGYMTPAHNNLHCVGSTFQRWLDHDDILPEDDTDNITKMQEVLPHFTNLEPAQNWAGVRTTTPDHVPVIGHYKDNIFLSTAHGSHGILSSLGAAYILADMITGKSSGQFRPTLNILSPKRFEPDTK